MPSRKNARIEKLISNVFSHYLESIKFACTKQRRSTHREREFTDIGMTIFVVKSHC